MSSVRLATLADIDQLIELGRQMSQESPRFSRLGYVPGKVRQVLEFLIEHPDGLVLAGEIDGRVLGVLVATCSEHFFSHDRVASELVVFVAPQARGGQLVVRMVKAFEAWAKDRGAREITMGISTEVNAERTAALYERLGFPVTGYMTVMASA